MSENIQQPQDHPLVDEATPPAAPPKTKRDYDPSVVAVPRGIFNLVVVGTTMLVIGLIIGVVGYDRFAATNQQANAELIAQAVGTAVASMPRTGAVVATPRPTADPNFRYDVGVADNPYIGPEDAPIVMIEFGDFRCGYCKRFNDNTLGPLLQQYEGQIRFVYRDYPILGPDSTQAALAAECADDQGQFWPFHDMLFANPTVLTRDAFLSYADSLALDMDRFTTCYDNAEHQAEVTADHAAGQALNLTGTPMFFINGRIVQGAQPIEAFQAVIDAELARLSGT